MVSPKATLGHATQASRARASASSPPAIALAALLPRLFACQSSAAAVAFLQSNSVTRAQRKALARLAGLESAWVDCDQAIAGNVADLASALVDELYDPFWFFRSTSLGGALGAEEHTPRGLFGKQMATRPLRKTRGFWTAGSGAARHAWLPPLPPSDSNAHATFDAVVHFVQSGSGTGVHVGDGLVLTCAHVVDARDDEDEDEDEDEAPPVARGGRRKVVMFPSGRTFIAECAAVVETADGRRDVAVLLLGAEVLVTSLPLSRGSADAAAGANGGAPSLCRAAGAAAKESRALPAAVVSDTAAALGDRLFCIGNPSNVDLESLRRGCIDFEPPTWHASVGCCEGYTDPSVQAARDAQRARGRAPTRGELQRVIEAAPVAAEEGLYLQHSCWTYWGHSGAPLFDERGRVVGLHCAWDDGTGMRHGQKLQHLRAALAAAAAAPPLGPAAKGRRAADGDEGAACKKRTRR